MTPVAALGAIQLILYVPLILTGRWLGSKWGNPSAGFWLPLLLGVLGFAIFVTGSHPATQPKASRQDQTMPAVPLNRP